MGRSRKSIALSRDFTKLAKGTNTGSGSILAGPLATTPTNKRPGKTQGGGWGVGSPGQTPASGKTPVVNPFLIPKQAGLNTFTNVFPNHYLVEWDITLHRYAADRVIKEGYTVDWATMVVWAYQSSPFIQSLFRTVVTAVNSIEYFFVDKKGAVLEDWTAELCQKKWNYDLRGEIAKAFFWGFAAINIDPENEMLYKYPMQQIDPINRMLRSGTFNFWDGVYFDDLDNLLFIQPSTADEDFLGWMQAITRMFVQMNSNDTSWIAAGRKLAFPISVFGYPETSGTKGANGEDFNPYKDEAMIIAKDVAPGSAIVTPFVRLADGTTQKNIEVEFIDTKTGQKAHDIYLDFNEDKKNEIREMVFGGTLTADAGEQGSRALGEVQERKLRKFLQPVIKYVIAYLNGPYLKKIQKFYTNFPKDGKFTPDEAERLTMEEIVSWSGVMQANGKRLTSLFFEKNGFDPELFEDAPNPVQQNGPEKPASKANDGNIPSNLRGANWAAPIEEDYGKKKVQQLH